MTTEIIQLKHVTKRYGDVIAVDDISMSIHEGQMVVLLGPSGCGKTSTLRLIAGLERPDAGTVTLNDQIVAGPRQWVEPEKRRVGMVFQDYALFPHLSVAENIIFGLRNWTRQERDVRVVELLKMVGLAGLGERMPHELSGGQQQRVALARALAPRPEVMLLDEPFSNLDAALRSQVRTEVRDILQAAGMTTVFVTHDQEEALSLSDQIAVMFEGRVAQVGSPQEIYGHPHSAEIASFIGEANFISAQAAGMVAHCLLGEVPLQSSAQGEVRLLVRPEMLHLEAEGDGAAARVTRVEFFGHDQRIHLLLAGGETLLARTDPFRRVSVGENVRVSLNYPVQVFAAPA